MVWYPEVPLGMSSGTFYVSNTFEQLRRETINVLIFITGAPTLPSKGPTALILLTQGQSVQKNNCRCLFRARETGPCLSSSPILVPFFSSSLGVNSKLSPLNPTPPPPRPSPNNQPHKFDSSSNRIDRVCTTTSNPITGTFLIPSTGVFEVGDDSFASGLDVFGKLTKFEISPDETCVTSVMMNTGFYNQSLAAGKITEGVLFKDTVPPREKCKLSAPMCNLNGPNDNVFVNTVQLNDGRIVAVTDSPTWLTVEGETLTIGERLPFSKIESGQIGMLGSGHPLWVPIGGKDTLVGLEVAEGMMNPDVLVYSVDSTDERSTLATLNPSSLVEKSGKWMPYFHSFGITHSPEE